MLSDLLMLQCDLLELSMHLAFAMTLSKVLPYGDFPAFLFSMFIYTEVAIGIATYCILFDETFIVIGKK